MRAYYVDTKWSDYGVGFIADTAREAKRLAFCNENFQDAEWTELRVKWKRGVNVDGLPRGEVDLIEGLIRGLYEWIYGEDCPVCEEKYADA